MFSRALDNHCVNLDNHRLVSYSKIPEFTAYYSIKLDDINVTEKYYRFLQEKKKTQKNWRFNKSKNHFSVGTNSDYIIFNCLEDSELIEFINRMVEYFTVLNKF